MGLLPSLLALAVLFALLAYAAVPLRKRPTALSRVTVSGGQVVVDVDAPVWLAFRRRLSVPVTSVTGARVLPAGTRPRLSLRVAGTGLPGLYLGYFWRHGTGLCYVVYRPTRDAVEIDVAGGRVKGWVVECETAEETVAALAAER